MGVSSSPNDSWSQCANEEHRRPAAQAIRSCSRLIGDRMDRQETAMAYYDRGCGYEDAGDQTHARADFDRAIEIDTSLVQSHPAWADSYTQRAAVLYHIQEYDRALADYDAAIAHDSHAAYPHYGRGLILFRRGDYADAMAEFDTAQHLAVSDDEQDYSGSQCEARAAAATELAIAQTACDHAVSDSGRSSSSLVTRGYLRFMRGQIEAASTDFADAVRRDARNPSALYGRGVAAIRLGNSADGQADINRARELDAREVDYYANAGLRP